MHKIHIPQTIIDRGIARRGARHIYDALDPARTALLVIDMQNCFLVPGFSVIEVPASRDIVDQVNALAAVTRRRCQADARIALSSSIDPFLLESVSPLGAQQRKRRSRPKVQQDRCHLVES